MCAAWAGTSALLPTMIIFMFFPHCLHRAQRLLRAHVAEDFVYSLPTGGLHVCLSPWMRLAEWAVSWCAVYCFPPVPVMSACQVDVRVRVHAAMPWVKD